VYHPEYDPELVHTKAVRWDREISRDVLSAASKNSLGSISTIFCLSADAADEVVSNRQKVKDVHAADFVDEEIEGESEIRRDTEQRALGFLQDKLTKLDWDEMQELVAGVLRAMGYKTRVSPAGPDRGRDIIASPDGFGFQPPRIVVEVKHRKGTMGALCEHWWVHARGTIRSGSHKSEPYTDGRMDADDLGKAIVEDCDRMDSEARALLPLKKIYWPV
jgi:restriction system protein